MKKLVLSLVSIIGFSAVMVACNNGGGGGGSNSAVTTPNSCGSAAQSGYLYAANGSAYPVESCASGEVMYGSSCISACSITTACGTSTVGYNNGYNNGYYNNGYNNALNGNCSTTGYTGNGYVPYQNTGYVAPYFNSYNYYSTGYYNGYYGGGYNAGYPSYYQRPVGVQAGVWVNF